jgi:hypothetical protein
MSKNKILFIGPKSRPSGEKIYSLLEDDAVLYRKMIGRIEVTENNIKRRIRPPTVYNSTIIRWGIRTPINISDNITIYNKGTNLFKAAHKLNCRSILNDNNVSIPKTWSYSDIQTALENTSLFPLVARPVFHSQGKNFIVINDENEFDQLELEEAFNDNWYFSQLIDKEREFRVHCAHGKVLAIMEKPPQDQIVWNHSQNEDAWTYIPWENYRKRTIKTVALESLKAVKALNLDFGAVDIITKGDMDNLEVYVLEINTAPSTCNYISEKYSQYFKWLFKSDERREHWDFEEFEAGKSLAWKNYQLNES